MKKNNDIEIRRKLDVVKVDKPEMSKQVDDISSRLNIFQRWRMNDALSRSARDHIEQSSENTLALLKQQGEHNLEVAEEYCDKQVKELHALLINELKINISSITRNSVRTDSISKKQFEEDMMQLVEDVENSRLYNKYSELKDKAITELFEKIKNTDSGINDLLNYDR